MVTYYQGGEAGVEVNVETEAYLFFSANRDRVNVGETLVLSGWVRDSDPEAPEYKEVKIWVRPDNKTTAILLDKVLTDENGNWEYGWKPQYSLKGYTIAGWTLHIYASYEDRSGQIWVSNEAEVGVNAPTRLGLYGCTSMFAGDSCTFKGRLEYTRNGHDWFPVVYNGAIEETINIETCVGSSSVKTDAGDASFTYIFKAPNMDGSCRIKASFNGDIIPYDSGGTTYDLYLASVEEHIDVGISRAYVAVSVNPSMAVPGQSVVVSGSAERGSKVDIILAGGTERTTIRLYLGSINIDSNGDFRKTFTVPWKLGYYGSSGEHEVAGAMWDLYARNDLGDESNPVTFIVPFPTRITAQVSPSKIHVGDSFKITGRLEYTGNGVNWIGLPNQEIDLTEPNGNTSSVETGDDGGYEFDVTAPSSPGKYEYVLSYKGNVPSSGGGGGGGVRSSIGFPTAPTVTVVKVNTGGGGVETGVKAGIALAAVAAAIYLVARRRRR